MQLTLYAPDVTCEHCIATIEKAVGTVEGATFVSGDPDGKSFVVEVTGGTVIDQVAAATESEGYPLGDAAAAESAGGSAADANWGSQLQDDRHRQGCRHQLQLPLRLRRRLCPRPLERRSAREGCCCGPEMLVARLTRSRG